MCRHYEEPKFYKNEDLIMELNDMMIRIKVHFISSKEMKKQNPESYKKVALYHPKPTSDELDRLQLKINQVLEKDWESVIKYYK